MDRTTIAELLRTERPSRWTASQLADALMAGPQAAASLASGMVAQPISGLAGLFGLGGGPERAANAVGRVQDMLTYQPTNPYAQRLLGGVSEATAPIGRAFEALRQKAGDAGYAVAGPVGGAVGAALPDAVSMLPLGALYRGLKGAPQAFPLPNQSQAGAVVMDSRDFANLSRMIEKDKPLSKQPKAVQDAIEQAAPTWYHGSPNDIYNSPEKWFRLTEGEAGVPTVWGVRDPFVAEGYTRGEMAFTPDASGKFPLTKSYYADYNGNGGVYSLRSGATNPFEYDAGGKQWFTVPQSRVIREAKAKGHDAVIFKNISDGYNNSSVTSDVIAWLDPKAIEKASEMTGAEFLKNVATK